MHFAALSIVDESVTEPARYYRNNVAKTQVLLDGMPVRDYIHVCDLCDAHSRALGHIQADYPSGLFNLGTGQGYSIQEILARAIEVTGQAIPIEEGQRRAGDPARLVADATRARETLQWSPQFGLSDILRHAWSWERAITGMN